MFGCVRVSVHVSVRGYLYVSLKVTNTNLKINTAQITHTHTHTHARRKLPTYTLMLKANKISYKTAVDDAYTVEPALKFTRKTCVRIAYACGTRSAHWVCEGLAWQTYTI